MRIYFNRVLAILLSLCVSGFVIAEVIQKAEDNTSTIQRSTSILVSDLNCKKFKMPENSNLGKEGISLLWHLGMGVEGLKGGSFVLLHDNAGKEYFGWIDENGEVQTTLLVRRVHRGWGYTKDRLEDDQEYSGSELYQRKADILILLPGKIEEYKTIRKNEGKEESIWYEVLSDGTNLSIHSKSLLATLGIAIKGVTSRAHIKVNDSSCTALVNGRGEIEKILTERWDALTPKN